MNLHANDEKVDMNVITCFTAVENELTVAGGNAMLINCVYLGLPG